MIRSKKARYWWRFVFLLLTSQFIIGIQNSYSQANGSIEYQVKAGFILNFLAYTTFPPGSDVISICVFDRQSVISSFQEVNGKQVAGRSLNLKIIQPTSQVENCNAVFVPNGTDLDFNSFFSTAEKNGILTIGESPGFAERGGVINIVPDGSRLRFEINLKAAARNRLQLSSKMLHLAKIVEQ